MALNISLKVKTHNNKNSADAANMARHFAALADFWRYVKYGSLNNVQN